MKRALERARRQASGFTLVEVLVALAIFGLIATASVTVMGAVLGAQEDLDARAERMAELQVARAILRQDLVGLSRRPVRGPLPGGSPTADEPLVRFVRGGWQNPGGLEDRGPYLQVEYRLVGDTLVRRAAVRPDPAAETPVLEQVLLRGVRAASFRVRAGDDWVEVQGALRAGAVALDLELEGLGTVRQLFLTGEANRGGR